MPTFVAVPCSRCAKLIDCEVELGSVGLTRVTTEPHTCKPQPRGADIEIYDPDDPGDTGVIRPNFLRINGVDILTPEGCPVKVEGLVDLKNYATVTVTMFARSIKVHGGDDALEP